MSSAAKQPLRRLPNVQRGSLQLSERQRRLLRLIAGLGNSIGSLDFQKLLFLYCQELGATADYEFVPYRFGAFSYTSYADRRKLIAQGLIEDIEGRWQLTPTGRDAASHFQDTHVRDFAHRHRGLRGDTLVAETYRRYPYFAIRSEIAHRVLSKDRKALAEIAANRPPARATSLTSIGYEGRTLESYLNALLGAGVTLLCDVRRNPISRKYGFAKSTLAHACDGIGIRYEHLPELGIPSDQRHGLACQADYDALFDEYERTNLAKNEPALTQIRAWVRAGEAVAVTCFERLPHQCHRHKVIAAVTRRLGRNFAATSL